MSILAGDRANKRPGGPVPFPAYADNWVFLEERDDNGDNILPVTPNRA